MADSRLLPPPFTATRGTATRRWKAPLALLLAFLLAKAAFPWLDRTARAKGFLLALANAEPGDDIAEEVVTLAKY